MPVELKTESISAKKKKLRMINLKGTIKLGIQSEYKSELKSFFFRATTVAYRSSQARGGIRAIAANLHLHHSHRE